MRDGALTELQEQSTSTINSNESERTVKRLKRTNGDGYLKNCRVEELASTIFNRALAESMPNGANATSDDMIFFIDAFRVYAQSVQAIDYVCKVTHKPFPTEVYINSKDYLEDVFDNRFGVERLNEIMDFLRDIGVITVTGSVPMGEHVSYYFHMNHLEEYYVSTPVDLFKPAQPVSRLARWQ